MPQLRTVNIDRYILPLREGGSVPGLVEADDGSNYVIKFRGSAQGPKVLIAELIGGELARALGLNVPELVFAMLNATFGKTESNTELQQQFRASEGLNIGLRYLPGAITFDPVVNKITPKVASSILWLDSLIMNVDRTAKNTNMLMMDKKIWLIDHGSGFYFHHRWAHPPQEQATRPFPWIKDHVLLPAASMLEHADKTCRRLLTADVIRHIISQIPDDLLQTEATFTTTAECRDAYENYLLTRIANSAIFVKEAIHERKKAI